MLRFSFCFFSILFFMVNNFAQSNLNDQIDKDYNYLLELYKHYHSNPELSFKEEKTAKRMAAELQQLGFEVHTKIGGHGVVGILKNGKGPTVMVRADMDALPIIEDTGKPYASKVKVTDDQGKEVGVMHACGHDMHMTVWAGTARALLTMKDQWKGTLIMLGQPAEERGGGAKAMLNDGLYERFPKPDYALALHVSAGLETGKVGYCPEYAMANVDMVDIEIFGEGGHGAYPHTTKDPIVLAARLILDFQTIVSREISPLEPAVLTVGSIHGGSKHNIIPEHVKLELTLRSYSDQVRNDLIEKIERTCEGVAQSAGIPKDKYPKVFVRDEFCPSLFNNNELCEQVTGKLKKVMGEDNVVKVKPVMAGEDFSRYGRTAENVPVLLFWLGAVEAEKIAAANRGELELPSLHSAQFAPVPETTIKTGVEAMTNAVLELMEK